MAVTASTSCAKGGGLSFSGSALMVCRTSKTVLLKDYLKLFRISASLALDALILSTAALCSITGSVNLVVK